MDMFESLLTQSSGKRVSPEMLEMLGRKASDLYQQKGIPLNDAVAQVVKDQPSLANEHVKRIVEFANTVTFQEMFQNSPDKNVHFDVADPGVILRDMKDGGSPAHDGKTMSGGLGDYHAAPKNMEHDGAMEELEQLFSTRPQSGENGGSTNTDTSAKLASAPVDHALHSDPSNDVYDAHLRLQAARSELAGAHENFDFVVKEARENLLKIVKDEAISPDGAGLGGVLSVLEKLASKDAVVSVIGPMIEKLAQDVRVRSQLEAGLEKRAGKVVNLNHPLVQAWSGLVKAAEDQTRTAEALKEIDKHLVETTAFLKSASVTSGIRKAMGVTGKVPAGLRQRFSRGLKK